MNRAIDVNRELAKRRETGGNDGEGRWWADCSRLPGAISPEKLHLGGGLHLGRLHFGRLLRGGLLLGGLGRGLREGRGAEAEYEAEAEGDCHQFLHFAVFSLNFDDVIVSVNDSGTDMNRPLRGD